MIAGRYRLEEVVGAGERGEVWRALDLELRRVVAVKLARSGEQVRREARIGAGLRHAGVVAVLDVVRERRGRWLVMEYLPSRSLAEMLRTGDLLPAGKAAEIGAQVAATLAAMHAKGLVHRDITPGNVLVAEDGTAKLTDLGIAVWSNAGSPEFLATDDEASDPAFDVHALGVTLAAVTEGGISGLLAVLTDPDPRKRPTAAEASALLLEVAENPPPASTSLVPRQLPPAPVHFEGREGELEAISGDVVVIDGLGGIGKTWLALRWAHDNLRRFPDGQLFVNLNDSEAALHGFLTALGVPPDEVPADRQAQMVLYRNLVAGKRMLILLDNARDAGQIADLLPGTPECTVLITSRGWMPDHAAHSVSLDTVPVREARAMLVRRIGEDRAATEPEAFEEILTHCCGLPLALAIVAGRLTAHPGFFLGTAAAILRGTRSRLDPLDDRNPATGLEAALEMSYYALVERHRELFELLGLAPGPDLPLPAVANLIDGSIAEAKATLRTLERQSLVDEYVDGRWRMHDLVRLYAAQGARLRYSPEEQGEALRRLVDFSLHTAHRATGLLDPLGRLIDLGPAPSGYVPERLADAAAALDWFDAEQPMLLAVQQLAVEHAWDEQVWQLASTLTTFHSRRGRVGEDLAVWHRALSAAERLDDPAAKALCHRCLGHAYSRTADLDKALDHLRIALSLYEATEDEQGKGRSYQILGLLWERREDDEVALEYSTLARERFKTLDEPALEAVALNAMGRHTGKLGRFDEARTHCEAALSLLRGHGFPDSEAETLVELGNCHAALGDGDKAREMWLEAVEIYRNQGRAELVSKVEALLNGA